MKINIESDIFDITKRIKEIDENYYIIYDTNKRKYELHNHKQENTYCLTIPYNCLDSRVIDLIYATNIKNIDNIIKYIDKNNKEIDLEISGKRTNQVKYMLEDIYNFSNNSSKIYDHNRAFSSIWR